MTRKQVNDHAVEVMKYIFNNLRILDESVMNSYGKTFIIKEMSYPDNDLSIRVYIDKKSDGITVDYTDVDDGPNDTHAFYVGTICEAIENIRLEFQVELLLNWERIKNEFLDWVDETTKTERKRLDEIEQYERELCARVPDGFEV